LLTKNKYIVKTSFHYLKWGVIIRMNLMTKHTKRLNLFICPETYDQLQQVAIQEGRKTGSLARHLLNRWAKNRENREQNRGDKK
jgi:hypothetical protein